jgi:hypothetical protein
VPAIEKIIQFLKPYPFVPYERREDAIRVLASSENGFEVALLVSAGFYTVCYALWHTEFSDEQRAVNGFINGLSDAVRLKVASRGKIDYRWTIQFREGGGWISGSTVGIFRYPFWKKKETRYLQNEYFVARKLGGEAARP